MFSFFRKKSVPAPAADEAPSAAPAAPPKAEPAGFAEPAEPATQRAGWLTKLSLGLKKTGSGIAQVFTGTRIDDALYEELEAALLMADAGVGATEFLLADLKRRVKQAKATEPAAVKGLLAESIAELLAPLQRPLELQAAGCTVMMVVGVNGAGKTTTIGKLTRHLAEGGHKVLLAAARKVSAGRRSRSSARRAATPPR
jgi:fused signal recognition particle receptor